jgi:hypothetical protein
MLLFFLIFIASFSSITSQEASFSPPKGWHELNHELLSSVQYMVVHNHKDPFPPSMNLTTEAFTGTMENYLNIVKDINKKNGTRFTQLGVMETQAGNAVLAQTDLKVPQGSARLMHLFFLENNTIYIITAAALSKDYAQYYPVFFHSFRSFNINARHLIDK